MNKCTLLIVTNKMTITPEAAVDVYYMQCHRKCLTCIFWVFSFHLHHFYNIKLSLYDNAEVGRLVLVESVLCALNNLQLLSMHFHYGWLCHVVSSLTTSQVHALMCIEEVVYTAWLTFCELQNYIITYQIPPGSSQTPPLSAPPFLLYCMSLQCC